MTASKTMVKRAFRLPASGTSSTQTVKSAHKTGKTGVSGGTSSTFVEKVVKQAKQTTFTHIEKLPGPTRTWPPKSNGAYPFPVNEAQMALFLQDAQARVCSGFIYKIMVKAPDGQDNSVVPFVPNKAQRRLMARLWHRNIIIKARP
jgi:hypothetical protein